LAGLFGFGESRIEHACTQPHYLLFPSSDAKGELALRTGLEGIN
jgi:hypothetical protein